MKTGTARTPISAPICKIGVHARIELAGQRRRDERLRVAIAIMGGQERDQRGGVGDVDALAEVPGKQRIDDGIRVAAEPGGGDHGMGQSRVRADGDAVQRKRDPRLRPDRDQMRADLGITFRPAELGLDELVERNATGRVVGLELECAPVDLQCAGHPSRCARAGDCGIRRSTTGRQYRRTRRAAPAAVHRPFGSPLRPASATPSILRHRTISVCEVLTFSAYRRSPRWRPRTSWRAHQFPGSRCPRRISATFRKMQGRCWLSRARVTSGSEWGETSRPSGFAA